MTILYAVGHTKVSVPPSLISVTYDTSTSTWGDWHTIIEDVTQDEWEDRTKWLKIRTPKSGATGFGSTVYAYGTDGSGAVVYKSTDRGVIWTNISTGLPNGAAVNALAVKNAYLLHNYAFCSDGMVYKQTNGTGNWGTGIDISMYIRPQTVDVGYDANHTIIATGGGVTAKAPEPYTIWTILSVSGAANAVWVTPP